VVVEGAVVEVGRVVDAVVAAAAVDFALELHATSSPEIATRASIDRPTRPARIGRA
jgi:hypothetical protein